LLGFLQRNHLEVWKGSSGVALGAITFEAHEAALGTGGQLSLLLLFFKPFPERNPRLPPRAVPYSRHQLTVGLR
jgi:hypothetical protein